MKAKSAVVVLSGGQDSTTCLAWAKREFEAVRAITFDYGQRHRVEIECARNIAAHAQVPWEPISARGLHAAAKSALTRPEIPVDAEGGLGGLPSTFTPGRNLVFLALAASYAVSRGIVDLVTGVCQTDFSGYPDCRRETIDAMEVAIKLGNALPWFVIHTPLMHLTKRESVDLAVELDALDLLALSHTCYLGQRPACGECPACVLRLKGFAEAGVKDPILYVAGR
jgi:7-cyano-7-deazaguanine synthase